MISTTTCSPKEKPTDQDIANAKSMQFQTPTKMLDPSARMQNTTAVQWRSRLVFLVRETEIHLQTVSGRSSVA